MKVVFEGFVVDREGGRLLHDGQEQALERRAFELLTYLMEHQDRVISKEELLEHVWGVKVLSDGVLSNTIAKLRRVLGQSRDDRQPIETVHGRGYRFRASRSQTDNTAPAATPAAPSPLSRRGDVFVGRESLMRSLRDRLLSPQHGSESMIILVGEAGIGKTRTARELARVARELGLYTWSGAAYEGDGAPAYWPWIQVLRAAHEDLGARGFNDLLPPATWAISQLVPDLCAAADVGAVPNLEPQAARFHLFEALCAFLKRGCTARPLLIILDDIHCTDAGTLDLLQFAARVLQEQPVTFLATMRSGESADAWNVEGPLARLARSASVFELAGLSASAIGELTAALSGDTRAELALALHGRTQGNPLFVRQTLDLMRQRGDWSLEQEDLSGAELPPAVRQVIRSRLRGLPDATRRVVAVAAVVGKHFDAALLAQVLHVETVHVLDRLEPALRMGIIEAHPQAPATFAFAHVLVRESLYDELGMRERGELHAATAAELERRHGHDPHHAASIAHHLLRGVPFDVTLATAACCRAAAAARETSSFETSAQILSTAITRLEQAAAGPETRVSLLLGLGEDHLYAGLVTSAWRVLKAAAEGARQSSRLELLAKVAPRLADCVELGVGDQAFARGVVEQALAASPAHSAQINACLLAHRAELAVELPAKERQLLLDRASSLAAESGVLECILEVAHTRAILRDPTCLSENAAAAEHFLELAERHPEAAASMRYRALRGFGAHLTRYLCALTACDLSAADLVLEHCRQIAQASHVRSAQFVVDMLRAGRALGDARLLELQRLIPALPLDAPAELPLEPAVWQAYKLALLEAQAEIFDPDALDFDPDSIAHLKGSRFMPHAAISRARRLALAGKRERARALLAQIPKATIERMPVHYGDLGALCALAELHVAQADQLAAETLYETLLPYGSYNAVGPTFDYRGAVAHYLGLLARMLGRTEAAAEHFHQAVELNRRLNMPRQLARSERELQRPVYKGRR